MTAIAIVISEYFILKLTSTNIGHIQVNAVNIRAKLTPTLLNIYFKLKKKNDYFNRKHRIFDRKATFYKMYFKNVNVIFLYCSNKNIIKPLII